MSAIEYANRILHEFRRGKIAVSVARGEIMECLITCTDGSVERVHGYLACEIMKRADDEQLDLDKARLRAEHAPGTEPEEEKE